MIVGLSTALMSIWFWSRNCSAILDGSVVCQEVADQVVPVQAAVKEHLIHTAEPVHFKDAMEIAQQQGQQALSQSQIADFESCYDRLLEEGHRANPPPTEPPPKKRGRKKSVHPSILLFSGLSLHYQAEQLRF